MNKNRRLLPFSKVPVSGLLLMSCVVAATNINSHAQMYVASGANLYNAGAMAIFSDVTNAGNVELAAGSSTSFKGSTWTNQPTATYANTGAVVFEGSSAQTINGGYSSGNQPSFSAITINNASNVTLTGSKASVTNALTFTNGHLILQGNDLHLAATATTSGSGAGKHVVTNGTGSVVKEGVASSSSFLFPIGQAVNDYTPATVTNNSAASRNYTANVKTNAASGTVISSADKAMGRVWQIYGDAAGSAQVSLTHNATTNAAGSGTNGALFDNTKAFVTQQTSSGMWSMGSGADGGSPVSSSSAAFTVPGSASVTSYFSKSSDSLTSISPYVDVSMTAFLQGAYNSSTGMMNTGLRSANLIPSSQPYTAAPFNYTGTEKSGTLPSTIVDWVLVELRDGTTPATVISRRAAFIKNDGSVVESDGTSPVRIAVPSNGNYYLALRHRNHLSVRTPSTYALTDASSLSHNFSTSQSNAYQDATITSNAAMVSLSGGTKFGLWGGNGANTGSGATTIRASGSAAQNDQTAISTAMSGNTTTPLNSVYSNADYNMNGSVRASGAASVNDQTFLSTVLGGDLTKIIRQH